MTENLNYQIGRELAKSVQKYLLAHQVDEQNIQEKMRFLGVVLGDMIHSCLRRTSRDFGLLGSWKISARGLKKDSLQMSLVRHWLTLN